MWHYPRLVLAETSYVLAEGTRSRENGKSPLGLLELFFERFGVRSQRVKFVLSQKPDVRQDNFFGLWHLTDSWIHKL